MTRPLLLALLVLACQESSPVQNPPPPPGGGDSIPIAGHMVYVPVGFTVNIFAPGVRGVRFLALGPGGAVYATASGSGQIVRLVDANGDGTAESVAPVLTGLSDPSGIAFRRDTLYLFTATAGPRDPSLPRAPAACP